MANNAFRVDKTTEMKDYQHNITADEKIVILLAENSQQLFTEICKEDSEMTLIVERKNSSCT